VVTSTKPIAVEYGNHVASQDEWAGSGSVDPAFAELFRAEGAPAVPAPTPEPDQVPLPAPPSVDSSIDTGRLFRSQGVQGGTTAVLALSSEHSRRLRTLSRSDVEPAADASPSPSPVPAAASLAGDPGPAEGAEAAAARPSAGTRRSRRDEARSSAGLKAGVVYAVVIGVTVGVAFVNALIANGNVGWPTGLALLAVTVFCALKVRREDDTVAIITPPIAIFLAAITAAQLFLGSAQHSLLNRAVVAFFTLANNWGWIIGATIAAVVIVLVRRRR
jgi:hypothetical protein